jgi:hypothetical protein
MTGANHHQKQQQFAIIAIGSARNDGIVELAVSTAKQI